MMDLFCWTRWGSKVHITTDGQRTLCGVKRDHGTGTMPAHGRVGCARCEAARDAREETS